MNTVPQKITRRWAEALAAEDNHKDHAFDTPFRYSDAMGCARALSYKAAGFPESDPPTPADKANMKLGTLGHEEIQAAQPVAVRLETKSQIEGLISGHCDFDDPEDDEAGELKNRPPYVFDASIGAVRSPGRGKPAYWKHGTGPKLADICQGGFNARGLGRSKVRIAYVSKVALSKQKGDELDVSDPLDLFSAEWVFTEPEWGPIVSKELFRLKGILAKVNAGYIEDRIRPDDDGDEILINPDKHPLCRYCSYEHACRMDGPGVISFTPAEVEWSNRMEAEYEETAS